MDLKDPTTLAAAWVLLPLAAALASAGIGLGVAAVSGLRLGALTVPSGYLTGIAAMALALELGASAAVAAAFALVLALAGAIVALALARRRGERIERRTVAIAIAWAAAAGIAAYAIGLAPVAGSGRSTVVGYIFNNDPAVHVSIVEALSEHGTTPPERPVSDFDFSTRNPLAAGYPRGSHTWPLFAHVLSGVDAFHLWAAFAALAAAMTALCAFAILRALRAPPAFAAVAAPLVALGSLPFAYLAQGGTKELVLGTSVLATFALGSLALTSGDRVTWRSLIPAALATTAALANFGPGALVWLGPGGLALLAALVVRARRRRSWAELRAVGVYALVAAPIALPSLVQSLEFYRASQVYFEDPNELGNLFQEVPWREALNVWLAYDYRYGTPDRETLTLLGSLLSAGLALAGIAWALRTRRPLVPLLVATAVFGALVVHPRVSPYFYSKTLLVLAPALGLAAAAGALWLLRRRGAGRVAGIALGGLLALLVLASNAMTYAGAWTAPEGRFHELGALAERYEGRGQMLVNDREQWAFYLLRRAAANVVWDERDPSSILRGGLPPELPEAPDWDHYKPGGLDGFPLLLERKRPGGSLPPSNYAFDFETASYRVWRRTGPPPLAHLPLGAARLSGEATLDCGSRGVRALVARARRERRELLVAHGGTRPAMVVGPGEWVHFEVAPQIPPPPQINRRGGVAARTVELPRGRYAVYLQGSFGPGVRLYANEHLVGDVTNDLGLPSQWLSFGEVQVERPRTTLTLVSLERSPLLVGSRHHELTGWLAVQPLGGEPRRVERVAPDALERFCGREVDWVELPA